MQSPIKLAGAATLIAATTSVAQLTQTDIDLIRIVMGQDTRSDQTVQHQYQPDPLAPIYQAYPNNPQLYRYLDRNPRYIDYYLGR